MKIALLKRNLPLLAIWFLANLADWYSTKLCLATGIINEGNLLIDLETLLIRKTLLALAVGFALVYIKKPKLLKICCYGILAVVIWNALSPIIMWQVVT